MDAKRKPTTSLSVAGAQLPVPFRFTSPAQFQVVYPSCRPAFLWVGLQVIVRLPISHSRVPSPQHVELSRRGLRLCPGREISKLWLSPWFHHMSSCKSLGHLGSWVRVRAYFLKCHARHVRKSCPHIRISGAQRPVQIVLCIS